MVFEAAELPQERGLAQKSQTSNPINADKGLVDSSTTQILLKKPNTSATE